MKGNAFSGHAPRAAANADPIPTPPPPVSPLSPLLFSPFTEEFHDRNCRTVLLVASLTGLLFGSLRWSLVALMAALLLLSPIVFLVLLLVGGAALYLNNSQ